MKYDLDLKLGMLVMMLGIVVIGIISIIEASEVFTFEQKCKEAGGITSHNKYECFHPSAIINVE